MKIFNAIVYRRQIVKLLLGLAGIAYALRIVSGMNGKNIWGISAGSYVEFALVLLVASIAIALSQVADRSAR